MRTRADDVVYVADDASGRFKIGHTSNLKLRTYHLSRDLKRPVRMVRSWPVGERARAVEATAQWSIEDRHDRGEWFAASEAEVIAAVEAAVSTVQDGDPIPKLFASGKRFEVTRRVEAEMMAALEPAETRLDFLLAAIRREIKRRERKT